MLEERLIQFDGIFQGRHLFCHVRTETTYRDRPADDQVPSPMPKVPSCQVSRLHSLNLVFSGDRALKWSLKPLVPLNSTSLCTSDTDTSFSAVSGFIPHPPQSKPSGSTNTIRTAAKPWIIAARQPWYRMELKLPSRPNHADASTFSFFDSRLHNLLDLLLAWAVIHRNNTRLLRPWRFTTVKVWWFSWCSFMIISNRSAHATFKILFIIYQNEIVALGNLIIVCSFSSMFGSIWAARPGV